MNLGAALFTQLSGSTGVAPLVANDLSSDVPFRIYPHVIPQKQAMAVQMPAIVYSIVGVERSTTYCGTIPVVATSMAVDCYATTYAEAQELADAVRAELLDFRGMLGGSVEVRIANIASEIELMDIEPGLYRVSQTWTIWHVET